MSNFKMQLGQGALSPSDAHDSGLIFETKTKRFGDKRSFVRNLHHEKTLIISSAFHKKPS